MYFAEMLDRLPVKTDLFYVAELSLPVHNLFHVRFVYFQENNLIDNLIFFTLNSDDKIIFRIIIKKLVIRLID